MLDGYVVHDVALGGGVGRVALGKLACWTGDAHAADGALGPPGVGAPERVFHSHVWVVGAAHGTQKLQEPESLKRLLHRAAAGDHTCTPPGMGLTFTSEGSANFWELFALGLFEGGGVANFGQLFALGRFAAAALANL